MAPAPLVIRELIPSTHDRQPSKGMEASQRSFFLQSADDLCKGTIWWWLSDCVWGCISLDCKLDLITIPMTLNVQMYQQEVLGAAVIPHFDNHPLATRPIFMDDNARPH